jgi:hypothetical protein
VMLSNFVMSRRRVDDSAHMVAQGMSIIMLEKLGERQVEDTYQYQ